MLQGELLTACNSSKYLIGNQVAAEYKKEIDTHPANDTRESERRFVAHERRVVVHEDESDCCRTQGVKSVCAAGLFHWIASCN
jgi:hypothetical protein